MGRIRIGWYTRSQWMTTFRPDGHGHITISDLVGKKVEDIAFTEIVCDLCGADAGAAHENGTEGRLYFDGADSLCEECGIKAEAEARERDRQELQHVRDTLRARGWPQDRLAELTDADARNIAHDWRLDRAAGVSAAQIAQNLNWAVDDVVYFAGRILEEANVHELARTLFDSLPGPKE